MVSGQWTARGSLDGTAEREAGEGRTTQWELITAPHAPRPVLCCSAAASTGRNVEAHVSWQRPKQKVKRFAGTVFWNAATCQQP